MIYLLILLFFVSLTLIIVCNNPKRLGVVYTTKFGMFLFQKTMEKGFSIYFSKKPMILNHTKFVTNQLSLHIWTSQVTFISNKLKEIKPDPYQFGIQEGSKFLEREQRRIINKSDNETAKTIRKFDDMNYYFNLYKVEENVL